MCTIRGDRVEIVAPATPDLVNLSPKLKENKLEEL